MTFTLDTSGVVPMGGEHGNQYAGVNYRWSDLTPFQQGYAEAALRSFAYAIAAERAALKGEEPDDRFVAAVFAELRFSDLAPETLAAMLRDCDALIERTGWTDLSERAGREAWRLRNDATIFYGLRPVTLSLGDDGLVRQTVAS